MHPSAMNNCQSFFDTYAGSFADTENVKVIEIGSQDVNGSLRTTCPKAFQYVGVDFQKAKGVDVVLDDPYSLPFQSDSTDIVISSSCFEHSEMFWLVFLDVLRILKPHGLFYLNAPSSGGFHRFPVDCWRFYPDSGRALVKWARRNGIRATVLESYTQKGGSWQDYVAVFLKDEALSDRYPDRILDTKEDFENGQLLLESEFRNPSSLCQNEKKLQVIAQIIYEKVSIK
jgi:SAM-dependent methyltransferase